MLIDTFLFGGSHEDDLLFLKFTLENDGVDLWIIQENSYSLQGKEKGLFANEVLKQDRFKPYLDKVKVISNNINPLNGSEEHQNFQREGWQRTFCYNELVKLPEDSLVVVSDVDEMIDFSDSSRKERFFSEVSYDRTSWVQRQRYWYLYNNKCFLDSIRIPIIPLKLVYNNPSALPQTRHFHDPNRVFGGLSNSLAYEYSYVFRSAEDIKTKKDTYSHTGFTFESVKGGLFLNCWPRAKQRGEKIEWNKHDLFEIVELNEQNSPRYIREHLEELNPKTVDLNYKENRKNWKSEFTDYGQ